MYAQVIELIHSCLVWGVFGALALMALCCIPNILRERNKK